MNGKNIKILFLINDLSVGGAEGVFINEVKALSDFGYKSDIYTLYPKNFKSIYDIRGYLNLIKKIKKENITHIYSTLDDANFVAKIIRIFTPFRLFCREANMTDDKSFKFKIADLVLNFLVTKLVMVAEAVKQSYTSYDPYHKNKMVVLYNGVDIPKVASKEEISDPIKILAVGSFTEKKGFGDLVVIIKDYVIKNNKNFILEVVGGGPLLNDVRSKIEGFGLSDHIKCLGPMTKNDLEIKYQKSDVFVLTSKKEGCPNVLLEASSYGLTPICFAVGAVPEIIENNISGIVIPKGDKKAFGQAICDLLTSPSNIRIMGQKIQDQIKNRFSFDTHMKNLLNILELN